jgi:hypothetical protein
MRRAIKMFVLLPVLFGMSKPVKAEAQTCYVASKNAQGFAPDHLGGRPLNHVIGVRIPASQPAFTLRVSYGWASKSSSVPTREPTRTLERAKAVST